LLAPPADVNSMAQGVDWRSTVAVCPRSR
jgi:hypothetical protein